MKIFVYEHVTAGGLGANTPTSLLREGHAMLAAIVADFQRIPNVHVTTLIQRDLAYDLGNDCRLTEGGDYAELDFEETVSECAWTLVIAPEMYDLLHDLSKTVLDLGGRLLGSLPVAIRLTGDKLATAEFWRLHRVPHPWTDTVMHADMRPSKPPWVLKPQYGAGSQATYWVDDAMSIGRIIARHENEIPSKDFIVQQFIPGRAASVALLVGKHRTIALAPAWQHLSNDGRFRYLGGSLPLPADLAERARRLALQAIAGIEGLRGYVGVDLVLGDDGVDHAIEINPRLTTSYMGLRQLCEQNLAELMLQCAMDAWMEPPTWKRTEVQFAL